MQYLSKGCQKELKKFRKNKENFEELSQLQRVQQGLLLDKDIIKQLKVKIKVVPTCTLILSFQVNIEAKIKLKENG